MKGKNKEKNENVILQRGSSDHGANEDWTSKNQAGTIIIFTKFSIGESAACHCGTPPMAVEHFLQDCHLNSPQSESRNLACRHTGEGEDLRPCGEEPPAYSSTCLSYRCSCLSERRRRRNKTGKRSRKEVRYIIMLHVAM